MKLLKGLLAAIICVSLMGGVVGVSNADKTVVKKSLDKKAPKKPGKKAPKKGAKKAGKIEAKKASAKATIAPVGK